MTITIEQRREWQRKGVQSKAALKELDKPSPDAFPSEAKLRAHIADGLRKMGWFVVDTSQDMPSRGGLRDYPDLVCHKHGRTLYIEAKQAGNKPTQGQIAFRDKLAPHLSPTLLHCFAWSWDDVMRTLGLAT